MRRVVVLLTTNPFVLQFDHELFLLLGGYHYSLLLYIDTEVPKCPTGTTTTTDTGSNAAVVHFSMDIIDNVDENPTALCSHDSGTSFPVGTTDVSCIVSDFSNNTNECDFSIIVQGRICLCN